MGVMTSCIYVVCVCAKTNDVGSPRVKLCACVYMHADSAALLLSSSTSNPQII